MFLKQQAQQGIHLLLLDKSGAFIAGEAPLGWQNSNRQMDMVSLPGGDYLIRRLPLTDGLILQNLDSGKADDRGCGSAFSTVIWLVIVVLFCWHYCMLCSNA